MLFLPMTDAVQIFGGRGLTATGMGKLIESVRALCIIRTRTPC